jgi:hypothetical protein
MEPTWHSSLEELVKKEAERSLALRWAHDESQRWCATWNTRLMFPAIILSLLGGAGATGSQSILPFEGATTLIGIVSLSVGVLQTIQNYFAFSKRSESHRIASLQYGKIHAYLALQLALPRVERLKPEDLVEYLKAETERLAEIAPQIPQAIRELFHKKFGTPETAVPVILNGLEKVEIVQEALITPLPLPALRPSVRVEV